MKSEEFALKTNVLAFASRSKAKAKPRRRTSGCSSTRTVRICERSWTDVEPRTYSNIAFPVSKRLTTLLRHGQLLREEDGAIGFWRLKDHLRNEFEHSQYWSGQMWNSKNAGGGGHQKRFKYCTDSSGQEILYLRALQGHSGRHPIDPSLQDNVLIPDNFFEYIYHIGCAINFTLHHKFRIDTGRTKFGQRKTDSILYGCESHGQGTTKIRTRLTSPHDVLHGTSRKRGKDTRIRCIGSTYSLLIVKDSNSIKQDVTQSSFTTHSQLIVSRKLL